MNTEQEKQALQNSLDHFKIGFELVEKICSDKRVKSKWFLVLNAEKYVSSPTLDFNQMQHFILGAGAAIANNLTPL